MPMHVYNFQMNAIALVKHQKHDTRESNLWNLDWKLQAILKYLAEWVRRQNFKWIFDIFVIENVVFKCYIY